MTVQLDAFQTFGRAHHAALQREADRARACWRSTHAGHNDACRCGCPACQYEREASGLPAWAALPGRAA